jgi:hypothetical protein
MVTNPLRVNDLPEKEKRITNGIINDTTGSNIAADAIKNPAKKNSFSPFLE